MEERSFAVLERDPQTILQEFLNEGLGVLRRIVKYAGVTTGSILRSFFQQRNGICFHRRASYRCSDGQVDGSTDFSC